MQPTVALVLTSSRLHDLAERFGVTHKLPDLERHLKAYISEGCEPLVRSKPADAVALRRRVIELSFAAWETRTRMLLAIIEIVGTLETFTDLHREVDLAIPEIRSQSAHLLSEDALENYETGIRIYRRTLAASLRLMAKRPIAPPAERVGDWIAWAHIASYLDLTATSVAWYVNEDRNPESVDVVEQLCVFVRELALYHGAYARLLLRKESGQKKRDETAEPSPDEGRWDEHFATGAVRHLNERIGT